MPMAAIIAGGVGAAGSIGSALIGSNAASTAAAQQAASQQNALNSITSILKPIINQGSGIVNGVTPTLNSLLTPGPNQTAALSQLPGFQFAQDWGQKAVQNIGTTTGLGGNTLAAGANFATGEAQQAFGGLVSQLQQYLQTGAGLETGAAGPLASGSQTALTGIGNAQASGALGSANAITGGITGGTNAVSNALLTNALFSKLGGGAGGSGAGIYGNGSLFPSSSFLNPSTPFNPAGGTG